MKQFEALTRKKDNQAARYLIVDDSVFARKSLAKMVESFGGQVAGEAGDGCTAITEYARTNPDIVLMDITMPQMEGIEAAEKMGFRGAPPGMGDGWNALELRAAKHFGMRIKNKLHQGGSAAGRPPHKDEPFSRGPA